MSGTGAGEATEVFVRARPRLRGLAYRIVGTIADADDVVQDAWVRWQVTEGTIRDPDAWLTTVTTRLAIDRLRAVRRRRAAYPGPWLPEPLVAPMSTEERAERDESLTLGFLTLLEQLRPVERAVLVLADIFAVPFHEIAPMVDRSEVACRQIASRARRRLEVRRPAASVAGADSETVAAFLTYLASGDLGGVVGLLAPEVVCVSDGGAERRAARRPVVGPVRVARFVTNLVRRFEARSTVESVSVNGDPGCVVSLDGVVELVVAFEVCARRVVCIRIIRNPAKLARLDHVVEIL